MLDHKKISKTSGSQVRIALFAALISSFFNVPAFASIVYDSISTGTSSSWMNAMDENGTLISVSTNIHPIDTAVFRIRNNLLTNWSSTITAKFYTDSSGLPGSNIGQGSRLFTVNSQSIEEISVSLSNIIVPSDPFWVTWSFNVENNATGVALGGTTTVGSNFNSGARNTGSGWTSIPLSSGQPGILLKAAVPIPSSMYLLISGFISLFGASFSRNVVHKNRLL